MKPPTTAPPGIVDAADQGAGEGVEQDAAHHVGIEVDDVRHHMPATAPTAAARPQPSASIQSTRTPTSRAIRVLRRRAHGEPERREAEEHEEQRQHDQGHADRRRAGAGQITPQAEARLGNGVGKSLISVAPDRAGHELKIASRPMNTTTTDENRRIVQRSQDDALDEHARGRRRSGR